MTHNKENRDTDTAAKTLSARTSIVQALESSEMDSTEFTLDVRRPRSLEDHMSQGFTYVNPNIRPGYRSTIKRTRNSGDVSALLLRPRRRMSGEQVLDFMARHRLRPAFIDELCEFGLQFPDPSRDFPIIAYASLFDQYFGASFDDDSRNPPPRLNQLACLYENANSRILDLEDIGPVWDVLYRFLAIRL